MDDRKVSELLIGAVDTHIHSGYGLVPRALNHVEACEEAMDAQMRAIVIKDHHCPTAEIAKYIQNYVVKDRKFSVFGGLALNNTTGGVSPYTVDAAIKYGAKIIWMPTLSAKNHHEKNAKLSDVAKKAMPNTKQKLFGDPSITILDDNGKLIPEIRSICKLIADADIVLASGHLSKHELDLLLDEAVGQGIKRIMINHPEHLLGASLDDMKDYAKSGFYLEHSITLVHSHKQTYEYIYEMIKYAGVKMSMVGSDLGQVGRPHPVDGFKLWAVAMLNLGLTEDEIKIIIRDNPINLLGL